MGSVAVGVVIVNGPTAATQFTADEQTKVVAEVQAGLGWLATVNPWATVSFVYDIRPVSITTQPDATATDDESRFRDPAVGQLGFQDNWNGVWDYIRWLRTDRRTNWSYCVFFVKGYPVGHFAYANISGPRIVMEYTNDGWGPDNIDRVAGPTRRVTSSAGPDEYTSSGCNCGGTWGQFGEPNSNCENCAGAAGVGCLMRVQRMEDVRPDETAPGMGTHLATNRLSRRPARISSHPQAVLRRLRHRHRTTPRPRLGASLSRWWHGWWNLRGGVAAPGAHITAVSRSADKLDVFVVGTDGGVYTAAWQPEFSDGWHGWWRIGDLVVPQGSAVHAVSRSADKLDIFVTDVNGRVMSAAWQPGFTSWHGWWHIKGGRAAPGAPVTAVSRSADKLDVFVVGTDGGVYTAAWQPELQ